jgi:hypothetical protein
MFLLGLAVVTKSADGSAGVIEPFSPIAISPRKNDFPPCLDGRKNGYMVDVFPLGK